MFAIYFIAFYMDIKRFLREKLFPSFQKIFALLEQSKCICLPFQRLSNDWYGLKIVRIICMMNKLPVKQITHPKNEQTKNNPKQLAAAYFEI